MIIHITGTVSDVRGDHAVLERGGIGYEVLAGVSTLSDLEHYRGREVTLNTIEYYEGSAAGGNLIPRLVGFLTLEDRAFFERFVKVKGMGVRKVLKAMIRPTSTIAAAIESGDTKFLAGLPGIGKRAADQIVAELKGKVADFAIGAPDAPEESKPGKEWPAELHDAMQVMIALGEKQPEAERWLNRALELHPGEHTADEWVRLAYRARSGSE